MKEKLILDAVKTAKTERELDQINQDFIKYIYDNKRILEAIRKRRVELFKLRAAE